VIAPRVAIVEWWPRVCGVTEWAVHVSSGFAAAGCDVDRITFSKSGKRLAAWGAPGAAWTPHRVADAVDVLRRYDLVVLSDIVCRAPEVAKKAKKEGRFPWYVDAIERAGVRWTTMLHDACCPTQYLGTASALLAGRSFSGVLVTTRIRDTRPWYESVTGGPLFAPPVEWVHVPYLPFDARRLRPVTGPRRPGVMMTSRLMSNKGQDVLLSIAPDLVADSSVWGFNSFGLPSVGWCLWELGLALGYEPIAEPELRADKAALTHPNAPRFYTGEFALRAGDREYSYRGAFYPYDGGVPESQDVDWSASSVHLSLTNKSLRGTLEYVSLDAIHAGTLAVVPEHSVEEAEYDSMITVPYRQHSLAAVDGRVREGAGLWDRAAVVGELNRWLAASPADVSTAAAAQLAEVGRLHDPRRVAEAVLEALR
jgi:hypothetical protein